MCDTPDLSTLPQRMRYAADVIDEYIKVSSKLDSGTLFSAYNLRIAADRLAEKIEGRVGELARDLFDVGWRKVCTSQVRQLLDAGWRKD